MKNRIILNISLAITLTSSPVFALENQLNNSISLSPPSLVSNQLSIRYDKAWKVSFAQDHAQIVQQIPDPHTIAARELKKALEKHGYHGIDPDKTFFNMFDGGNSSPRSYNGWEHHNQPHRSYTLTQASILNIFNQFSDSFPGDIDLFTGVYKQGMGAPHYNEHNDVRLLSSKLWDIVYYDLDIQASYTLALKSFWQEYGEKFTHLMRDNFAFSAHQQYTLGLLSQAQYQLATAAIKGQRSQDICVYRFDIYGYDSTDILLIEQEGRKAGLLYIPGANQSFIPFNNERHLKKILYTAIQTDASKQALAKHFSLYNRQDGVSYSGVDSALSGLADDSWDESYLMMKKHPIYDDVFARLTEIQKARMASDGDTVIKSNSESRRDYILNTTYSLFTVLPIMDLILPELGIPITLAIGSTQLGLSIDQSINGDTLAERLQGTKMTAVNSALLAATVVIPTVATYGRNVSESLGVIAESIDNQILLNRGVTESEMANFNQIPRIIEHPQTGEELLGIKLTDQPRTVLLKADGFGIYREVEPLSGRIITNSRVVRTLNYETGEAQWLSNGGLRGGGVSEPIDEAGSVAEAEHSEGGSSQSEILLPEDLPERPGIGGSGYADMRGRLDDVTRDFLELEMRVDPYSKLTDINALHNLNQQAQAEIQNVPFLHSYQPELKGITTFRGDERLPDELFHSGFNRRVEPVKYIRLAEHTRAIRGVISTSTDESVAVSYAIHNQRGYVYAIELNHGGAAVDTTLRYETLNEVATLNIPPEDIMFAVGPFNNTEVNFSIIKEQVDARTAELLINPHSMATAEVADAAFEKLKASLKYDLSPEMSFSERYENRQDLFWHEDEALVE
ncbi:dermonecrotic toxin domain-containing protein [Shewanella woodyi]|uniref:dermonecrotic toxin domain-containing protein n=1 Tax=Shewanella woodyi TaxID=60961 RepID=UPI003747FA5E